MLFNSLEYLLFFPIVFIAYWLLRSRGHKVQNGLLLLASYYFYGVWDWRFLSLIVLSSLVDYNVGRFISNTVDEQKRKRLLWTSVIFNLGILGFFKYFNFFKNNLELMASRLGFEVSEFTLDIILPVGISFYTFQTLSYTIDVYRKDIEASTDILDFFCFVSFFPQLVAGPIERAKDLLPQFSKPRIFKYDLAIDGSRQIILGFFKKVVIADNCAAILNPVFENPQNYNSASLVGAAILFSIQIYGDFAGYSDIAIGTAKLFGIELKQNFRVPYFSRSIAEFWRRWHISLSSWFKDYLYIPLGGSQGGKYCALRNIIIIFLVSGFWHGANWTYVLWGLMNGLLFIPVFLLNKNRENLHNIEKVSLSTFFKIIVTFITVTSTWIMFRSANVQSAFLYYKSMLYDPGIHTIFNVRGLNSMPNLTYLGLAIGLIFLFGFEWYNRAQNHGFSRVMSVRWKNYVMYIFMTHFIVQNFFSDQPFIYFQF